MPRHERPPLPPKMGYYLRHALQGHYRIAPVSDGPRERAERTFQVMKAKLLRAPESPEFRAALLADKAPTVGGTMRTPPGRPPLLLLDGYGAWDLRLPRPGRSFDRLREIMRPEHLMPVRFAERQHDGAARHLHTVPLRWHPRGHLSLEVRVLPSGAVTYDAWAWLPGVRVVVPLSWEERERIIGLFRDLTASYFRCAPAPSMDASAAVNGGGLADDLDSELDPLHAAS